VRPSWKPRFTSAPCHNEGRCCWCCRRDRAGKGPRELRACMHSCIRTQHYELRCLFISRFRSYSGLPPGSGLSMRDTIAKNSRSPYVPSPRRSHSLTLSLSTRTHARFRPLQHLRGKGEGKRRGIVKRKANDAPLLSLSRSLRLIANLCVCVCVCVCVCARARALLGARAALCSKGKKLRAEEKFT
jgi:hypothetical protein